METPSPTQRPEEPRDYVSDIKETINAWIHEVSIILTVIIESEAWYYISRILLAIFGTFIALNFFVGLFHDFSSSTLIRSTFYPRRFFNYICLNRAVEILPICHLKPHGIFQPYADSFVLSDGKIDGLREAALTVHSFSSDMRHIKSVSNDLIFYINTSNILSKVSILRELQKLIEDTDRLQELLIQLNVDMINVVRERLSKSQRTIENLHVVDQPPSYFGLFNPQGFQRWRRSNELQSLPLLINGLIHFSDWRLTALSSQATIIINFLRHERDMSERIRRLCSGEWLRTEEQLHALNSKPWFKRVPFRIYYLTHLGERLVGPHMVFGKWLSYSYAKAEKFTKCMQKSTTMMQEHDGNLMRYHAEVELLMFKIKKENEEAKAEKRDLNDPFSKKALNPARHESQTNKLLGRFIDETMEFSKQLEAHQKTCVYPINYTYAALGPIV